MAEERPSQSRIAGNYDDRKREAVLEGTATASDRAPVPSSKEQQFISDCIVRIVNRHTEQEDRVKMQEIVRNLQRDGAEAIILGCTDLFMLVSEEDSPIPIINSTEVLENAVVEWLKK